VPGSPPFPLYYSNISSTRDARKARSARRRRRCSFFFIGGGRHRHRPARGARQHQGKRSSFPHKACRAGQIALLKRSRSRRGSSPSTDTGSADAKKRKARRAVLGNLPSSPDYNVISGTSTSGSEDGVFYSLRPPPSRKWRPSTARYASFLSSHSVSHLLLLVVGSRLISVASCSCLDRRTGQSFSMVNDHELLDKIPQVPGLED
jgi:hypothetical protein